MTDKEKGELRRIKILEFIKVYIKRYGYSHIKKMLDTGMLETDAEDSPRAIRVPGCKFVWEE